jgi:subtilase family serine protease
MTIRVQRTHGARRFGRLLAVLLAPIAASWMAFSPVADAASNSGRQMIPGTDAPGRAGTTRLGDANPAATISFAVMLPLRNAAALQQFIVAVSNPASPQYGRYLTPAQFTDLYAPTTQQVSLVTGYLESQGISITSVASNREIVDATGTVAAVSSALGTTIGRYHDPALLRDFVANDSAVSVPNSVAPLILGVAGLNNHYLRHHSVRPHVGGGPAGGYTPVQLKTAYDVNPLAAAGFTGSGQHVGLFELDGFQQSNINTYDSNYGLASPAPTVQTVDGGSGPLGSGQVEVELDIEVIQAIAPAASITVWEGPNTDQGVLDTYNAMVTSNSTPANSTSWGSCEPNTTPSVMTSEDQIFAQAASQGMSLFAASGDNGAFDCGTSQLAVDNPADDPNITGTGGTRLNLTGSNTYSSESAWSNSGNATGTGGGLSTVFARPSWQTGPGVQNSSSNGKRQVPDVASDSDPATGVSIFTQGTWTVVGGTSAAAPSWAAFAGLYNQDAAANGRPRLGFANPALYSLAAGTQTFPAFHDVTTGNNLHYNATPGWDYPTGWGSYDAYNLARDLIGGTPPPNNFSISANPTSLTLAQGAGGTSTIATAVTSGSAQTISLNVTGTPSGATASLNPGSVTAGSSSTLSVNAGTAAAGSYTLTVTGTGTSATHSTTVSLTVTSSAGGPAVTNGGFEAGTFSGWTTSGTTSVVTTPHSGTYAARIGGTSPTNGDSTMQQTITVPASGGTLTFWYQTVCPDTLTYDWSLVQIRNTSGSVLATPLNKTCSNTGTWVQVNFNLAAYANQHIVLYFLSHDDNYPGDPTYTLYDDISVH